MRVLTDDDLLEPLEPDSGDPVGDPASGRENFHMRKSSRPERVGRRRRDPRAMRMWLLATVLAVMALLQFGAAAYVSGVKSSLRDLEEVWRAVEVVDADRAEADRALYAAGVEFGEAPNLERDRESLYDAATSRFSKFWRELDQANVVGATARDLHERMASAITIRRRELRAEEIEPRNASLVSEVGRELDAALARWRLEPHHIDAPRLTAAHELRERLGRFTDEPAAGLTVAALSRRGLHIIDMYAERVTTRSMEVSPRAELFSLADRVVVVVDNGTARAYDTTDTTAPRWVVAADRAVPAEGHEHAWVQVGRKLARLRANGQPDIETTVPTGSVLVAGNATGAFVAVEDAGISFVDLDGTVREPEPFLLFADREVVETRVAAFVERGRLMLARIRPGRPEDITHVRVSLPRLIAADVLQ
jgi:hypothetical protein